MCSPLFDRTPISRDRDCYGLTGISEISGGCQRFGLRRKFDHFECGGPQGGGSASGFNQVSESGSRRAKMTHKSRKKFVKIHVLKC
jgi:hypothetical protein